MTKKVVKQIKCKHCGKKPSEIQEYIDMAESEGYPSPEAFVRTQEGTLNKKTGLFYCTKCYIELGQPLGKA
jgi:hypothetical protein